MPLFEGKTPAERNKTIAAIVLGVLALLMVARLFFGSSSTPTTNQSTQTRRTNTRRPAVPADETAKTDETDVPPIAPQPIYYEPASISGAEAGRNIFAFYVPPATTRNANTSGAAVATPPPATPTPTPPLLLTGIAPASVYARTGNFSVQVSGDKFTPASRIYVDGQEMPTEFKSPQQLTATVSSTLIAFPGARQLMVRTPDNQLYSNNATLNVMQPPVPTSTFVGFISRKRSETAVLKNQKGDLLPVQSGDIVEGRFRVVSISERAVDLVDKDLNIKHTLPYVDARNTAVAGRAIPGAIQPPPPPPPNRTDEDVDEEP